jgi:small GTP-binding protein
MSFPSFTETPWENSEIENAWLTVEAIQEELNYKQAQDSLRSLVNHLDLTEQEEKGLETSLKHLTSLLDKLEQSVVQIAAFGMVGRGKSSLLNALVGKEIFLTGPLHGVTRSIDSTQWQLCQDSNYQGLQRLTIQGQGDTQIQLIDTPGIDEVDGETRETLAKQVARQVDLILFVVAGDMSQVEYLALSQLREAGKPMILVFNKVDQYSNSDREAIYAKICDERVKELLSPEEIVMVAAAPLITQAVRSAEGNLQVQRHRGDPQVDSLKLKILEILDREGKSLVALNTMLYADSVNEQIVARKMALREEAANQLIQKAVLIKALAVALNPVTIVDLLSGAVIDVAMILALSRLYGIAMTQEGAIQLLQKIALSMGGISISEFFATLGLSSLKGLLGITAPLTGGVSLTPYLGVATTQAGVAGVSCYAIGQATKTYLANDANWGPEGPKAVVARILDSLDEASIINRIKGELLGKLRR